MSQQHFPLEFSDWKEHALNLLFCGVVKVNECFQLARPVLFREQSRKSSEPDSGHGSEAEESKKTTPKLKVAKPQSILKQASPVTKLQLKSSPPMFKTETQQKAFQPQVPLKTPQILKNEEIQEEEEISETVILTQHKIVPEENELLENSFSTDETSSTHPNTSDYIEEAKRICAGVFSNISERFSGEKGEVDNSEVFENEESRDRASSYAIVDDRSEEDNNIIKIIEFFLGISATEREVAPIRKSPSMAELLLSQNGVLIFGILGAIVSAGYMYFRYQYS